MEQLLDFFQPEHYALQFHINKTLGQVIAKAKITGHQLSSEFKFHAVNLAIRSIKILKDDQSQALDYTLNEDILNLTSPSTVGQDITLEFDYSFKIERNMEGVYLSSYPYQDREELIVATQFESHYARQAFPSIDEPAAKATFDLKIITPDLEDQVIANTPIKSEKIIEYQSVDDNFQLASKKQKKIVTFLTTPKMSTYLLAFVLGKFHAKTTTSEHGVKITSYCGLHQNPDTLDFANHIAAQSLDFYDQLFGTPYPLPKLDQVALPDFESGAMENWGLVTYRESCLLASEESSLEAKEYIATVIAHELSHQWFGNLVTMRWWDDLWLNESFATMIEYLAVDHIHPEYHIWEQFFTGEALAALRRDALPGVQSVQQPVHHPAEIATLFDGAIVYAKGARLMLMLMRSLGEQQFFAGLKDYFKKHQYQNTVGDDLWSALQSHANFDVKAFMHAWISQPGYPMVELSNKKLKQKRFLLSGQTDQSLWPLPEICDDMSGYYLIKLSETELSDKISQFDQLSTEQRFRLLIDQLMLAKSPHQPIANLLPLLLKFKNQSSYAFWNLISSILAELKIFISPNSGEEQNYQKYLLKLIQPELKRLGTSVKSTDSENDQKLRPLILAHAIFAEHQPTINQLAADYRSDFTKLQADLRYAILRAHFKTTNEVDFDKFLSEYQSAADPDLKNDLLSVLTSAKQPAHQQELIDLLGNSQIIRPQDHLFYCSYLLSNHQTKSQTLTWCYQNWQTIKEIAGEKSLEDYPRIIARNLKTLAEVSDFKTFFKPLKSNPALSRALKIAFSEVDYRLKWLDQNRAKVLEFLAKTLKI